MNAHAVQAAADLPTDPVAWGERLAAAYRDIGARTMRELPIYHHALDVEAIGFQHMQDDVVGIIVTPWFMNVVMPADELTSDHLQVRFPAGSIAFTVSEVAPVGRIASCSLFSPMFEFADMATARAVAHAALGELMTPSCDDQSKAARTGAIDRRAFLRGSLTERAP